jgi:hypothetical protein
MKNKTSSCAIFCFILLLLGVANSGIAQERKVKKPIFVVLTNGDTIFAKRLTHIGVSISGWISLRDTAGKKHRIWDKDYKYYNYKGTYYYSIKVYDRNRRSDYWTFWLENKGAFYVYARHSNDHFIYYLIHPEYRGFVNKKTYKTHILPIFERCEAYKNAFPPESRIHRTWLTQMQVFNRLCP